MPAPASPSSPDLPSAPDPLAAWLAAELEVRVVGRSPVGGGCIHDAWQLDLADGGRLFAKTGAADTWPLLEAEARGLRALAAAAAAAPRGEAGLRVPQPVALGRTGSLAVLVLPWLELGPCPAAAGAASWRRLGAGLARLHRDSLRLACDPADRPGQACGWPQDNFIGATPQTNGWLEDWARFFVERRLAPQLELLARRGAGLRQGTELLAWARQALAGHRPEPCLVHGDLWSGNAALGSAGEGVIFDPAVYRGDREVDLAMARLFGGFPAAFFEGYAQEWPLPAEHRHRQELYNLYHRLNHANLFGGAYLEQSQACLDRLLAGPPVRGLS